ncbi:MAG: hypothetical protein ACJA0E_002191 [Bermanella sp.]|jgi:hypothetical protein
MISIHSSVILALHCEDDKVRNLAKAFVVDNKGSLVMDFYNIGVCDHIIWEYFKDDQLQNLYWPFLDLLQTRHIQRSPKSSDFIMYNAIEPASGLVFEDDLEALYKESLKLRFTTDLLDKTCGWID